ncbi:MAG TPA: LEA type 2 family protein [Desulfobaccales bacterium]|nr:LEA type 2 family protein [Desulfobaccales bacterium]
MKIWFDRPALALWVGLLMLFSLPACGVQQLARGDIQAPKVKFQGLALGQPTSQGWPLTVSLLLTNPNSQPLDLQGYDYELWLEGRKVAQGASREPVNLPPGGQTVARVPILVKLPALMGLAPMLLQPEPPPISYQVAGGFRLAELMGGLVRVPFRFQGRVTPTQGLNLMRSYLQ